MKHRRLLPALLAHVACGGVSDPITPAAGQTPAAWRTVATAADRARLRGWRDAWLAGLRHAHAAGHGAAIARAGNLFDPDRALDRPIPPAGPYRCRILKLGAKTRGLLDSIDYPAFVCRVANDAGEITLAKLGGSQRRSGRIYPDTGSRAVFLGTLTLGDETASIPYGADRLRDIAGVVERIDERRWRIVFPAPAFESLIDIVELIPEGNGGAD